LTSDKSVSQKAESKNKDSDKVSHKSQEQAKQVVHMKDKIIINNRSFVRTKLQK